MSEALEGGIEGRPIFESISPKRPSSDAKRLGEFEDRRGIGLPAGDATGPNIGTPAGRHLTRAFTRR